MIRDKPYNNFVFLSLCVNHNYTESTIQNLTRDKSLQFCWETLKVWLCSHWKFYPTLLCELCRLPLKHLQTSQSAAIQPKRFISSQILTSFTKKEYRSETNLQRQDSVSNPRNNLKVLRNLFIQFRRDRNNMYTQLEQPILLMLTHYVQCLICKSQ